MLTRVLRLLAVACLTAGLTVTFPTPARGATTGELYPASGSGVTADMSALSTICDSTTASLTNPNNITADDNIYVTHTPSASDDCAATAYDMNLDTVIPRNATITDITLEISAKRTAGSSEDLLAAVMLTDTPDLDTALVADAIAQVALTGTETSDTVSLGSFDLYDYSSGTPVDSGQDLTTAFVRGGYLFVGVRDQTGGGSTAGIDYVSVMPGSTPGPATNRRSHTMATTPPITIPVTIDTTPLRTLGETLADIGRTLIRVADELDGTHTNTEPHPDQ